ncbi:hypothetical protein MRB53_042152 [Persea americana]|nr:hypothetical protein MRB53_042152 [Persea americana]
MRFSTVFLAIAAACSAQTFTNGTGGAGVGAVNTTAPNNGTGGAGVGPVSTNNGTNGTGGSGVGPVSTTTVFATRTVLIADISVAITVSIIAALPTNAYTTLSQVTVLPSATVIVVVPISAGSVVTGSPTVFTATGATVTAGVATAGAGTGSSGTGSGSGFGSGSGSSSGTGLPKVTGVPASSGAHKVAGSAFALFAILAATLL